jgi:hypothetical protein
MSLEQLLPDLKFMPDEYLQEAVNTGQGPVPGWLALTEIVERQKIRGEGQNVRSPGSRYVQREGEMPVQRFAHGGLVSLLR